MVFLYAVFRYGYQGIRIIYEFYTGIHCYELVHLHKSFAVEILDEAELII
jgi:hypothetical protein